MHLVLAQNLKHHAALLNSYAFLGGVFAAAGVEEPQLLFLLQVLTTLQFVVVRSSKCWLHLFLLTKQSVSHLVSSGGGNVRCVITAW
jgi:hypothetical protein